MPKNNNLKPTKFPMEIRFGEKPRTEYKNVIENIKVTLKSAPSMQELRNYLVDFVTATWEDIPTRNSETMTEVEKDKIIYMIFQEKILPSAQENIRLTFLLEGISYQDVSHILRYREATFSAECSADKWWSHKNIVVPTSIQNSPEFLERYKKLHEDMKNLYVDMIDSREISLIDARYILTRACETYYWMSMSLREALKFVRHRIDKQIQPESDNILAYRMWEALITQYPLLVDCVNIHQPAGFYVNTARTNRSTNLFQPDVDSDIYEWNEADYLYGRERQKVNGTNEVESLLYTPFLWALEHLDKYIEKVRKDNIERYGSEFF